MAVEISRTVRTGGRGRALVPTDGNGFSKRRKRTVGKSQVSGIVLFRYSNFVYMGVCARVIFKFSFKNFKASLLGIYDIHPRCTLS